MRGLISVQKSDKAFSICFFKLLGFGGSYEYDTDERSITIYVKFWKFCTYLTFSIL